MSATPSPDPNVLRDKILEQALDLSGQRRREFMDHECAGNSTLAAEIERLLLLHEEIGDEFLVSPASVDNRAANHGLRMGRYQIEEEIGSGGASQIYRARDTLIHRRVALKVLRADGPTAAQRKRFLRELRMLGSINHENVVQLYDFGEHEGNFFLVLEYLVGEDLREAIQQNRCGDLQAKIEIARQIIAELTYVYSTGVIYRDLKPAT